MHHAPLPARVGEHLGSGLHQPQARIGDDQANAGKPALFQVLEEGEPTGLVLLGALDDAEEGSLQ